MQGYNININIYAESKEEAEKAKECLCGFINEQAKEGRAVSAEKICGAFELLKSNLFIYNKIIRYFS